MTMQHDDPENLFEGISIEDLEKNLISVDIPETQQQQVEDEIKGDPEAGTGKPPEPDKSKEKPTEDPAADTIVVDEEDTSAAAAAAEAEKEKDKDKGGTPGNEDDDESPSYLHAAALREEGVLPNLDITTLKGKEPAEIFQTINKHINDQVKESITTGIDQYKNGFGDRAKQFLEALDKGVPLDEITDNYIMEDRYEKVKESELESDEDLQKSIYSDLLNMKGFAPQKITKIVEKALQDGELLQEAKDGLGEIKTAIKNDRDALEAESRQLDAERKAQNEEMKAKIEKTIGDVKEIIPGIAVTEKEKEAVTRNLTVPVKFENRDGRQIPVSRAMELRAKDPLKYEMKLNYFIEKGFFDDDAKFDDIIKKATSTATSKLLDKMKGEPRKAGKTTVRGDEGKTTEDAFVFPEM
jgi:hypothetical protein